MRDHDECEAAICEAMARGKHGTAEFLAARCDVKHGAEPNPDVAALRAAINPTPHGAAERED